MAETTFHSIKLPGIDAARAPEQAAEFNTGTTYAVKDYCTYQGVLYRCITAHAAGAWNASHFTATNLDNEFDRKLDIPASSASAPANPRVGDLWIDNDEDSAIYNVDAQPTSGSTNAVQSGGTYTALNGLETRKANRKLFSGDYSASATYEVNQLVMNGQQLYRCKTKISTPESWTAAHWQATSLNAELDRLRSSEADTDMIAETFGTSNSYAIGDYVVYNTDLYRCISPVSDTGSFDPDDWTQVMLTDEIQNETAQSMVAEPYDTTKTYAVGDYVRHGGLYRCKTAITTTEVWTAAHWQEVTLADDVSDLKSALISYKYLLTEPKFIDMKHLQIGSTGTASTNASYDSYIYFLNGLNTVKASGNIKAFAYYSSVPDNGSTSVNSERYTTLPSDGILTAPLGGTYILLRLDTGATAPTLTNINEDSIIANIIKTLQTQIPDIVENVGVITNPQSDIIAGTYVEWDGDIHQNNSFSTTEPFYCDAGDIIDLVATGYSTSVSMISKTNSDLTTATPIIISIDSSAHEYKYVVLESGYYACSFDNRVSHSITLYKYYSGIAILDKQPPLPLIGKSISFCGDSVAYGAGYANGYVGIIAARNNMTFTNYGHSGWTMATGFSGGICNVVETMAPADFILLEGGINDYGEDVPLGAITEDGSAELNTATFYGAVEYAVRKALEIFTSSHIIYVITHVRKKAYCTANNVGHTENDYWEAVRNVCHKYGIMIADVNRNSGLNTEKNAYRTLYTDNGDGTHPNELGYTRYYVPVIEAAMKTLVI